MRSSCVPLPPIFAYFSCFTIIFVVVITTITTITTVVLVVVFVIIVFSGTVVFIVVLVTKIPSSFSCPNFKQERSRAKKKKWNLSKWIIPFSASIQSGSCLTFSTFICILYSRIAVRASSSVQGVHGLSSSAVSRFVLNTSCYKTTERNLSHPGCIKSFSRSWRIIHFSPPRKGEGDGLYISTAVVSLSLQISRLETEILQRTKKRTGSRGRRWVVLMLMAMAGAVLVLMLVVEG